MVIEINWILIIITCCFIGFDLVTGIIKAVANKEMDSTKMRQGLWHKIAFLLAIGLGVLCEIAIPYAAFEYAGVDISVPVLPFVCGFIILIELTSVLENLGEINPELKDAKFMEIFKGKDAREIKR